MRRPVASNVPITQIFKRTHNGVDFSGRFGRYVYAPEAGKVIYQRQILGGNVIRLIGKTGEHRLAHLSKYLVKNGASVEQGTIIGAMGRTGLAFGIHLHWGLIRGGKYVNPLSYLNVSKRSRKPNEVIAREVIAGKWGDGSTRTARLKKAGYNPATIQAIVNRLLR